MKMQIAPIQFFLPFGVLFLGLQTYFGMNPGLSAGMIYAFGLGLRLPGHLGIRHLFPMAMLMLFFLVIGLAQERTYSEALRYTTQALIMLRALLYFLNYIQTSKVRVQRPDVIFTFGLFFELVLSATLAFSTLSPVSVELAIFAKRYTLWTFALVAALTYIDQRFILSKREELT